jgi:hypothetical protein
MCLGTLKDIEPLSMSALMELAFSTSSDHPNKITRSHSLPSLTASSGKNAIGRSASGDFTSQSQVPLSTPVSRNEIRARVKSDVYSDILDEEEAALGLSSLSKNISSPTGNPTQILSSSTALPRVIPINRKSSGSFSSLSEGGTLTGAGAEIRVTQIKCHRLIAEDALDLTGIGEQKLVIVSLVARICFM